MAIQDALALFTKRQALGLSLPLCAAFTAVLGCKGSAQATTAPHETGGSEGGTTPFAPGRADELLSVSHLLAAYKDDASKADAALKGKRVRIWGKAAGVTQDTSGALTVVLGGDGAGGPQATCLLSGGASHNGAAIAPGTDVTLDCTSAGLQGNVVMKDCEAPHCAMSVCEKMLASGLANDCKAATKDWSDSASFHVASGAGAVGGYVECEPNDKVYYLMLNELNSHPRANQLVLPSSAARVIVTLASDDPIPADVGARTRAWIDAL
jgi:putative nucleic acid binding protein